MDELNPLYLSHIVRVKATYSLSSPDLEPDEITKLLSLQPDYVCRRGDARIDRKGHRLQNDQSEGVWLISSEGLDSKDLNAHIDSLLTKLLPHERAICEFVEVSRAESYIDVLWESSYLYAGTGPILDKRTVEGMAKLKASIGFDIYQIDAADDED